MTFRTRGYLPHIDSTQATYFITFRLAGSLPSSVLKGFDAERQGLILGAESQNRPLSIYEKKRLNYLYSANIERYLDSGIGDCWLSNPDVAREVVSAIKYFDGVRYALHAWCVMPNHVHVLISLLDQSNGDSLLIPILHSWKSYTAEKANQILNRKGKFWQEEYFDYTVRTDSQFAFYIRYILQNPVSAKLCNAWQDWPWSGCSRKIMDELNS